MKINQKGEISLFTIQTSFILLIVTMLAVTAFHPIASGLLFGYVGFESGTVPRLLIDLLPWSPVLMVFYLLMRQG